MTYRTREHGRSPLPHHSKHAATIDGHRPDDPHAVTGWKQQERDALVQRQSEIQSVLDEPHTGTIRREGHEPYSDESDYGQRVTAIGDITDDYEDQMDEELDPGNPYAKKAMFGQWEDRGQRATEAEAKSRKETGFTGHIGIHEFLGMGTPAGNAAGRARQEAGARTPAEEAETEAEFQRTRTDDPLKDKGSYRGHIGINEYLGVGTPEGNRIAADRQAKGAKEPRL